MVLAGSARRDELREVADLCATLAGKTDIAGVYQDAAKGLCDIGSAQSCGIWRVSPLKSRFVHLSWYSSRRRTAPPLALSPRLRRLLATSGPRHLTAEEASRAGLGAASGPASLVPLLRENGLWGVAVLVWRVPPNREVQERAAAASAQIGVALEAAETRSVRSRLEWFLEHAYVELALHLSSASELDSSLASFCGWVGSWLSADECEAWTAGAAGLSRIAAAGCEAAGGSALTRTAARALAEKAVRTGTIQGWTENGKGSAGSALVVPVSDHARVVGVVSLYWKRMLAYDAIDRSSVLALMPQVEAVVERLAHQGADSRCLTELAGLSAAAQAIVSLPDTPTLIRAVTRAATTALRAPMGGVALLDKKGRLVLSPHGHIGVGGASMREFASTVGKDGALQRALLAASPTVSSSPEPLAALLRAETVACAPLTAGQDPFGVLFVGYDEPRVLAPGELGLLSAYASQSALALSNLTLRDSLTKHLDRLGTFSELGRTLASSLDLDQTLHSVLDSTHDVLEIDAACIFLKDAEDGALALRACHGDDSNAAAWVGREEDRSGFGLPALAIEKDQLLVSKDLARDGRNKHRAAARSTGPTSAMVTPLKSKGRSLGALCVCASRMREFSEYDRRLLSMLADSAGIAIENARMYEQEKERVAFLASLVREANHRIRNSLQTIAGLLEVELTAPERPSAEALRKSITRIYCIAALHGALSQREIQQVEMKDGILRIGDIARRSAGRGPNEIMLQVTGARLVLPSQKATSLSLAINELMDNALQHGLAAVPEGKVTVSIAHSDRMAVVTISDNGVGLPEGFDLDRDARVGLTIAAGVAAQDLGGKLTLGSNGAGTRAQIRFPLAEQPTTPSN